MNMIIEVSFFFFVFVVWHIYIMANICSTFYFVLALCYVGEARGLEKHVWRHVQAASLD